MGRQGISTVPREAAAYLLFSPLLQHWAPHNTQRIQRLGVGRRASSVLSGLPPGYPGYQRAQGIPGEEFHSLGGFLAAPAGRGHSISRMPIMTSTPTRTRPGPAPIQTGPWPGRTQRRHVPAVPDLLGILGRGR